MIRLEPGLLLEGDSAATLQVRTARRGIAPGRRPQDLGTGLFVQDRLLGDGCRCALGDPFLFGRLGLTIGDRIDSRKKIGQVESPSIRCVLPFRHHESTLGQKL